MNEGEQETKLYYKMNLSLFDLTKKDVLLLKAFAIISIVLHNFYHQMFSIGENEMSYRAAAIFNLFDFSIDKPSFIFAYVLAYLGHFGVQLFIFSTGYGLAKSFENKSLNTYPKYFLKKVGLLYLLIIIGLVWYVIFNFETVSGDKLTDMCLFFFKMSSTFSYHTLFKYIGPWWYLCLALQLYIIFPLAYFCIRKYREKGAVALFILSYILVYGVFKIAENNSIPIFANALGHLPEFIFGIAVATFSQFRVNWKIFLSALVLFVLSCFNIYFFPLSFLSILIVLLVTCKSLSNVIAKHKRTEFFLLYIGKISMFIFILNAIVRGFTISLLYEFDYGSDTVKLYSFTILHLIVVLLVAMFTDVVYNYVKMLIGGARR